MQAATEQSNLNALEIQRKISKMDELPSYSEVDGFWKFLNEESGEWFADPFFKYVNYYGGWTQFCRDNKLWLIPNVEFVEALASLLKQISNGTRVVEVCSGDGMLARWLRKYGVDIVATDNYSLKLGRKRADVERLSVTKALRKYNPRVVVGTWTPSGSRIPQKALRFPSVAYYVGIGEESSANYSRRFSDDIGLYDVENVSRFTTAGSDDYFHRTKVSLIPKNRKPDIAEYFSQL
jgi:hypothetical protein